MVRTTGRRAIESWLWMELLLTKYGSINFDGSKDIGYTVKPVIINHWLSIVKYIFNTRLNIRL